MVSVEEKNRGGGGWGVDGCAYQASLAEGDRALRDSQVPPSEIGTMHKEQAGGMIQKLAAVVKGCQACKDRRKLMISC